MFGSLRKLAALPGGTKVCCGHEYTESNARFALSVDPLSSLRVLLGFRLLLTSSKGNGRPPLQLNSKEVPIDSSDADALGHRALERQP